MQTSSGLRWLCSGPDQLPAIAEALLVEAGDRKVLAFYGEMGAGKTTLIKALCSAMSVEELVTSPTFTIVNEYSSPQGKPVYHFDFYRIKSESEAFDLGYENYLYSGNYCFIEWPEKISSLLPEGTARILIEASGAGEERTITLTL